MNVRWLIKNNESSACDIDNQSDREHLNLDFTAVCNHLIAIHKSSTHMYTHTHDELWFLHQISRKLYNDTCIGQYIHTAAGACTHPHTEQHTGTHTHTSKNTHASTFTYKHKATHVHYLQHIFASCHAPLGGFCKDQVALEPKRKQQEGIYKGKKVVISLSPLRQDPPWGYFSHLWS